MNKCTTITISLKYHNSNNSNINNNNNSKSNCMEKVVSKFVKVHKNTRQSHKI